MIINDREIASKRFAAVFCIYSFIYLLGGVFLPNPELITVLVSDSLVKVETRSIT